MKVFVFLGKSATGKNSVFKKVNDEMSDILTQCTPFTTRPMRQGEVDGLDYHFLTDAEVDEMKANDRIIESRTYDTIDGKWTYGTLELPFLGDHRNVCYSLIGTIETLKSLKERYGEDNVIPIYITLKDDVRLKRAFVREEQSKNPNYVEMCRRFVADTNDFSDEILRENNINCIFYNNDLDECVKSISMCIYFYLSQCGDKITVTI